MERGWQLKHGTFLREYKSSSAKRLNESISSWKPRHREAGLAFDLTKYVVKWARDNNHPPALLWSTLAVYALSSESIRSVPNEIQVRSSTRLDSGFLTSSCIALFCWRRSLGRACDDLSTFQAHDSDNEVHACSAAFRALPIQPFQVKQTGLVLCNSSCTIIGEIMNHMNLSVYSDISKAHSTSSYPFRLRIWTSTSFPGLITPIISL